MASALKTHLLPNFGIVIFAVTLFEVLFLGSGANGLFRDSDSGWHIRNGEAIVRTWTIPRVDTFSYTKAGATWFPWEWLSDAIMGVVHLVAGLPGVAFLTAITIALVAWGAARLSLSLDGNLFLTAVGMAVLIGVTGIHWLARPHVFSWLLALVFLSIVETERRFRSRALWVLPVISCLWANLHGSFLLGPAILFIYAIAASPRRFGPIFIASLLATLINPFGLKLHQHVLTYLSDQYLMDHISEFRSFSFHSPGALFVEIFLVTAICGIVAMLRQQAYAPAMLSIGLLHLALYSARHLPTAAILSIPLSVGALTREAEKAPYLRRFVEYSGRLRNIDRKIPGFVAVVVVLAISIAGLNAAARGGIGFDSRKFPAGAVDYLENHNLGSRVFAKDQWGGYLIYRFAGRSTVFTDGRSDFYGWQFLEESAVVAEGRPGWDAVLKRYDVRFVLVSPDNALVSALQLSPGWKRVYTDSVATIFEKDGGTRD